MRILSQREQYHWRVAMPWSPEESAAIRSDPNHQNYYDIGPYTELPSNTPEEKGSSFDTDLLPSVLYRGVRVKDPTLRGIQNALQKGIGTHWSTDIQNAAAFGDPYNHEEESDDPTTWNPHGLLVTIKHPGAQHIDPNWASESRYYWDDEHEHTLRAGVPIEVTDVHHKDPSVGKWRRIGPIPGAEYRT